MSYSQSDIDREIFAALVSKSTWDVVKELDHVIANRATLLSIVNRGIFFIPAAADARASLLRARAQLVDMFLPIALNAIRDRSRNLNEIKDTIAGYMAALRSQIGISLEIVDTQNMSGAAKKFIDDLNKKAREWPDPTKIPWWGWIGIAVAGAYIWRSIR